MKEQQTSTINLKKFIIGLAIFLAFLFVFSLLITLDLPLSYTLPEYKKVSLSRSNTMMTLAIIHGAFLQAKLAHQIKADTGAKDLTRYINFVLIDTTNKLSAKSISPTENYRENSLQPCSSRMPCLQLHNGGILQYDTQQTFGKISPTNAIVFNLNAYGLGNQGLISLYLYADGTLKTGGHPKPNTVATPSIIAIQHKDPDYMPQQWTDPY